MKFPRHLRWLSVCRNCVLYKYPHAKHTSESIRGIATVTMAKETKNVDRLLKHLFDGGELNVYESNILNLGVGAPGPDLLMNCCDIFKTATDHCLKYEQEKNGAMLFQYGPTMGTYEARSAIAKYFTETYSDQVFSEDLIITTGATQGLHYTLSTLVDFNGFIFVDEVTYMIALEAIKQFTTLTIVPIRLNDDGVNLVELESSLQKHQFKSTTKPFWGMYYAIPTYHNPTGILFSEAICKGLIALARKYDVLIICDDVYNILYYQDAVAPKRLFAYDARSDVDYLGNVISNGSFSKIIGPGVRLGWLEVPPRLKSIMDTSGIIRSGGCFNNYTAGILSSLFQLGLGQQHIKTMYNAYRERMLATCEVLQRLLPTNCSMLTPRGGYFIWIRLPEQADAKEFQKFCLEEEKIFFIPGSTFTVDGAGAKNCLRLSIAFHSKDKLIDGATRFCGSLRKFLKV